MRMSEKPQSPVRRHRPFFNAYAAISGSSARRIPMSRTSIPTWPYEASSATTSRGQVGIDDKAHLSLVGDRRGWDKRLMLDELIGKCDRGADVFGGNIVLLLNLLKG